MLQQKSTGGLVGSNFYSEQQASPKTVTRPFQHFKSESILSAFNKDIISSDTKQNNSVSDIEQLRKENAHLKQLLEETSLHLLEKTVSQLQKMSLGNEKKEIMNQLECLRVNFGHLNKNLNASVEFQSGSTTLNSSLSTINGQEKPRSRKDSNDEILDLRRLLNCYEETPQQKEDDLISLQPSIGICSDSISPSKSIWTPLNDDISPVKLASMEFYSFTPSKSKFNLLEQSKGIWSESDCSDHSSNTPVNADIMEEYTLESHKLRVNSFEKTQRASIQTLVDKILKTNDQPASLLLQQKVSSENEQLKNIIIDCVTEQTLAMVCNRFGNFLMQRCLENGTVEQVNTVMQRMFGYIFNLSCDRFGCHVVQKAIELSDEHTKIMVVGELGPHFHETVVHKFGCHVWQRIFEVEWTVKEHQKIVNNIIESHKNSWASIANDENGSLVVQCIFEHFQGPSKQLIMAEIKEFLVEIARGQWGNWVIQHIMEHGEPLDRSFVFKVVADNIFVLSTDQYSSKVVEKALRAASAAEFGQIMHAVYGINSSSGTCNLIEMMMNQYANYVVQHILHVADASNQEKCVRLMAPHITVLRTSKYGQRVAAMVERMSKAFKCNARI